MADIINIYFWTRWLACAIHGTVASIAGHCQHILFLSSLSLFSSCIGPTPLVYRYKSFMRGPDNTLFLQQTMLCIIFLDSEDQNSLYIFLTKTISPTISLFMHLGKSMCRHGGQKQEKYLQKTSPSGVVKISNLNQNGTFLACIFFLLKPLFDPFQGLWCLWLFLSPSAHRSFGEINKKKLT